ncbi:hypothetical protein IHY49_004437, partial [Salmonella enterica]|nr:hypothetical protein [Salmonella enterica]
MPRKIMLVFFLFISEVCYAQVVVSEFNLSDINRGGMTKAQAEKLLIIALKYQKYDLSLDGVFVDGDLQDKHGN